MYKKIFLVLVLITAVVAVSCGKKVESKMTTTTDVGLPSFVYTSFADAKAAAEKSDKHMVLEFSTDW